MPRLFVVRHGQTEWSQNGRHTGLTDIPLTEHGVEKVKIMARRLVGPGQIIDKDTICTVLVSPRQRAHRTFHLLFEEQGDLPHHTLTEEVAEWNYGEFEGLVTAEIHQIKPTWKIWTDGAPGGEMVSEMQTRIDGVIRKVREHHKAYLEGKEEGRDVLIVAHGHFSRVMVARWLGFPLCLGTHFNVEPGSVTILGYNHNSLEEPTLNALNLL